MIIKIDVDGVIRNINQRMCDFYNLEFNENVTVEDITDYDIEKVFIKVPEVKGVSACKYYFEEHSQEVLLDSKPYEGVSEAIQQLRNAGHKVIIVTWQYTVLNKVLTLLFLEENHIPYDDIFFTREKWLLHADYLIDDNPEFITESKEISNKIMINMPYNKDCDYDKEPVHNCKRVNNLKEAVEFILKDTYKPLDLN